MRYGLQQLDADGQSTESLYHTSKKLFHTDRWYGIVNIALLVCILILIFQSAKIFWFHMIFIVLTFGAFYWRLRAFVIRASLWVIFTSVVVLASVLNGQVPPGEMIELPMLSTILVLVFVIARQRSKAQTELQAVNEDLEKRVIARTAELTEANDHLVTEINQHKQTAATLKESEDRYRRLVEVSFETVLIHRDGRVVYINPPGLKLLRAAGPEQILGRSIFKLVHDDYIRSIQTRVEYMTRTGHGVPPIEEKLVRLDGSPVDVEIAAIPILYEGQPATQVIIRDISERKEAQAAQEQERTRIARDLHDMLGQNLGYLHLKLDELVSLPGSYNQDRLRKEFVRLRDVANEAYEIVRDMLATSLLANVDDLTRALLRQAKELGQRSQLAIRVFSEGKAQPVPPVVQQQILFIFREALTNVIKHASATRADFYFTWSTDILTIALVDNGVGFDPELPSNDNSYGLGIMQERAIELGGNLTITSDHTNGTTVLLKFSTNV